MIGQLIGTVVHIDDAVAILDVQGVGFEIRMPRASLSSLHTGTATTIYTVMNVSQDAITLFGFLAREEKHMFLQLQKVSGVGPKVALSLLSTLPSQQLAQAIHDEDAAALAQAPGLGKKGAQKIILELKGSIDLSLSDAVQQTPNQALQDVGLQQVLEGLMSLGWRKQDAQEAIDMVITQSAYNLPLASEHVPQVLRLALAALDTGR